MQAHLEKQLEELKLIIKRDEEDDKAQKADLDEKNTELDNIPHMAKDYDRNKRVALNKNPTSARLLLDPTTIPELKEAVAMSITRIEDRNVYVEKMYNLIKSMLTTKQSSIKT